ncbi:MAG: hypothetical protein ACK4GN_07565 [Runella sp.]
MKKILFSTVFCLYSTLLLAQQRFILSHIDHRGFVNISSGVSLPTKSLMKGDPTAPSDVVARRGSSFQVALGYRFTRRLGAMTSFTSCLNESGTQNLLATIQQSHTGGNWSVSGGTWNCAHWTAGPYYSISAGLWTFDARLTGGYSWVQRPSTELKGNLYDIPLSIKTTQVRSGSLTVGAGASIRCKISRHFAVAVHSDYFALRASFDNLTSTLTVGNDQVQDKIREVHPIGMLNLNGGLSFLF